MRPPLLIHWKLPSTLRIYWMHRSNRGAVLIYRIIRRSQYRHISELITSVTKKKNKILPVYKAGIDALVPSQKYLAKPKSSLYTQIYYGFNSGCSSEKISMSTDAYLDLFVTNFNVFLFANRMSYPLAFNKFNMFAVSSSIVS